MMRQTELGRTGIHISRIGLGCMGMSEFYGPTDEQDNLKTLDRALELGINFLDTADVYGSGANEELLGRFLQGKRAKVVLATKFGIMRDPANPAARGFNGRPDYVKKSCDASLKRLGVDCIDLYYSHRVDANTPIEETAGALADLVKAGKIRAIGFSEISAANLRRAAAVHPVSAVQSEYSLWSRDVEEAGVVAACAELGTIFVAYSPLGRGFLTGTMTSANDLAADDFRRTLPRFEPQNMARNAKMLEAFKGFATARKITPAQLALSWLMHKGVIPIPGTRKISRLEENAGADDVDLTQSDMQALEAILAANEIAGTRYHSAGMAVVNR